MSDVVTIILTDAPIQQVKVSSPDKISVKVTEQTAKIIRVLEGPQGPTGPQGATGPQGPVGPQGPAAVLPDSLRLFLMWDALYPSHHLVYTYTLGNLTSIDMYEDNTLAVHVFNKTFVYTLGVLTQIVVTRVLDSSTETRDFNYTLGNLTSVDVAQA